MARGRFLNRKIGVSDKLNDLPDDTCRLLATWIIPFLDKNGVYYARPGIVKSTVFTLREDISFAQVETYLQAMHDIQLIVLFDGGDGKRYQYWPGFEEEQPNLRPEREKTDMPEPPDKAECLQLWGADNCQATDGQPPGNDLATDSQEPGYLKAKHTILQEIVSEDKALVGASIPDTPQTDPKRGLPAPSPAWIGDPPPPVVHKTMLPDEIPKADPVFIALWKDEVMPELRMVSSKAIFEMWYEPITPLARVNGVAYLSVNQHYEQHWALNRLKLPIQRALSGVIGEAVDFQFIVLPPGGT